MDYHGFGYRINKNNPSSALESAKARIINLVETAVIETASENPSTQLSPGAVSLLIFPRTHAE